MLNMTAPVRVAVIDVAGPLADLDCGRAEHPPYTAAWILVCRAGRPLGHIKAAIVPAWLRSLRDESSAKSVNRADDYPSGLARRVPRHGRLAARVPAYLRARAARPPPFATSSHGRGGL
jgi:hypothetical protein